VSLRLNEGNLTLRLLTSDRKERTLKEDIKSRNVKLGFRVLLNFRTSPLVI
jgi:hypothetical protein